ncbi:muts domain V-domain-containing protein [Vararia minispora EC-137]|uniref:Muts domain V-domain-containing protein n=1 Tax=Vararia minispora EC-137 TaxID=1314806 RepID=A0ACB8QAL9_9AGAM|nr:muts domain V-domain-containing protein [Vararia minispora EC-137]
MRPRSEQTSITRQGFASWQSRPGTAVRPFTSASSRYEVSFVIALIESRGIGREVGMACLDKDTGRVVLVQVADCQTYVKTMHQMHLHRPSLILIPDTFFFAGDTIDAKAGKTQSATSLLVQCVQDEFPGAILEPVSRKFWNDEAALIFVSGLQFISQLCVQDDERAATLLAASNKYYALSATSALFKYAELKLNTSFASASLRIRFIAVDGTMMIDPDTARNLELVGNMSFKKSSHSLFGVLNHTWTAMASRLLRTTLMAPSTVHAAIEMRLNAVEELVQSEDRFTAVKDALRHLSKIDFDKLVSSLAASEAKGVGTARMASSRVAQLLNLRNAVKTLPELQRALRGSNSQLLRTIFEMLSDERLGRIEALVRQGLNEDAALSRSGLAGVNARVYAVKANCNPLLDVARETYKENVGDIQMLHQSLCDVHKLPLVLVYKETGFVLALKRTDLDAAGSGLPPGFINVSMQKGRWLFTSLELKKRNARMKDALDEALLLSYSTVEGFVHKVLQDIGALYKASEAVALLDMLWSFARVSIFRPEFTGTLAIKAGRHPVLENVQLASGNLVANDVYCSESSAFQIIQGPKYAHAFTYLRQIGLLTVMAMSGCFVPAEYASFRIHDAMLTRLSNDDDIEKSLSTFANEMVSSAMILGLATPRSLVLVDELGRGTSPTEGVGISHAIAEALIDRKVLTPVFRHFHELSTTLSRQPSVVNLHLSVNTTRATASNIRLTFRYKIADGLPIGLDHYAGLELARLADLPSNALAEAHRISHRLTELEAEQHAESEASRVAARRRAVLKAGLLRDQLQQICDHSELPARELLAHMTRLQRDAVKALRQNL